MCLGRLCVYFLGLSQRNTHYFTLNVTVRIDAQKSVNHKLELQTEQ